MAKAERTGVGTRFWRDVMIPDPTSVLEFMIKILISVSGVMSGYCRALAGREHDQIYVFLKGHSLQFGVHCRQASMDVRRPVRKSLSCS